MSRTTASKLKRIDLVAVTLLATVIGSVVGEWMATVLR